MNARLLILLCIWGYAVSSAAAEDTRDCNRPLHEQDFPESRALFRPRARSACRNVAGDLYHYSTDSVGRRTHDLGVSRGPAIVALGCSFTFGIGVNDDETLPAHLERILGRKMVNLGVPSGGLSQARWIYSARGSLIPESKGSWVLYTMLPDHIHRHSRSGPWFVHVSPLDIRMGRRSPFYKRVFGRAMQIGAIRFLYDRLLTGWSRAFYKARLGGEYATSEELESFAKHLNQLSAEYFGENPEGKFLLNVWYLEKPPSVLAAITQLHGLLDQRITLLSMPGVEQMPRIMSESGVPDHPRPEAYRRVAEFLARALAGESKQLKRKRR